SVLLTQDVEKFGALQKPRETEGEHRDRFAHEHRVVVVRPARGERDTCDNGDPNYDGAAPMDPPPPGAPAHRTILALSVAVAEADADYAEQAEQQRGKSHMKYGDSCQDGMWGVGREE